MHNLTEYLMVIAPPESVRNRIQAAREEFSRKFNYKQHLARPHIALLRFFQRERLESQLKFRLDTIARGQPPLLVELNGFGFFPSHTLFIHVDAGNRYKSLVKSFREAQALLKADPEREPHFMLTPFVKIGHRLLPWQYEQSLPEYQKKQFTARFMVDSLLLLKRREGEKAYQIVQRMELLNEPLTVRQGALF